MLPGQENNLESLPTSLTDSPEPSTENSLDSPSVKTMLTRKCVLLIAFEISYFINWPENNRVERCHKTEMIMMFWVALTDAHN